MPLSDTTIKAAKPLPDKPYKIPDEKGMYLFVHNNGSKYFRFDYRFNDKRKTLALGIYPETTLKYAREKRDVARKQIAEGIDPSEYKKAVKSSKATQSLNSFEIIAREWGAAYSGSKGPLIRGQCGHPFRFKAATHSGECCHPLVMVF